MQRTCAVCGRDFDAKRKDAITCGATCRSNRRNGKSATTPTDTPLVRATRAELEAAGKLDTRLGQQALVLAVGMSTGSGVGQFAARYRAAWKALDRAEQDMPLIGLSRHVVVGDTDKEAQSAARRAFALWYDALIHLWRAHGVGLPRQMIPAEFEAALEGGYIIAGSPSTVRDRLKRDNETADINYCLCRLAFGSSWPRK